MNLIVFTEGDWPILMSMGSAGVIAYVARQGGNLQDKVRILHRTKPTTKSLNIFRGRQTNIILVIYITKC